MVKSPLFAHKRLHTAFVLQSPFTATFVAIYSSSVNLDAVVVSYTPDEIYRQMTFFECRPDRNCRVPLSFASAVRVSVNIVVSSTKCIADMFIAMDGEW